MTISIAFLLLVAAILLTGVAGVVVLVVWLVNRGTSKPRTPSEPIGPSQGAAICSRCGMVLPAGAPQGLCPRCVMRMGLDTQTGEAGGVGPHGTKIVPPAKEDVAQRFPNLEIVELLGQGGMGTVYKARQPKLNRLVALKILAPEKGADPRFAERFLREAQALARLNHPNIVSVYDYGEAEGMFFLLMEYVDGATLRRVLQEGRMKPEEALTIVPPICEALHFAHEQGVVHRDIKPENILIDVRGRVKVADFGIAKLVGQEQRAAGLTEEGSVIGTPHYMAPEQIEKPQLVDHRADIYSLGVVLYEMLTGELPLGRFQPPSRQVSVDVRLDEIVLRALEKKPERRYQHVSHVKTDVENVSIGSTGGLEAQTSPAGQKGAGASKSAAIAAGAFAATTLGLLASATLLQPGLLMILTLFGAAGLLTAAIHFAKQACDGPNTPGVTRSSTSEARTPPASLLLLCVLMLVQGFYALVETVLRQQPGLAIFLTSIGVILGVGLLFLKPWARTFALAWVWVSYVLYLVMGFLMFRGRLPGSDMDLSVEIMGRGAEDPRFYTVAVLVCVSAAFTVPWVHWLLTRDHIKRLFGIEGAKAQALRAQAWGFATGVVIIVTAVATWMVMPKRFGTIVYGKVTSAENRSPIKATVTVTGSRSRVWTTSTDRYGSYAVQVPPDAGILYRDAAGEHGTDIIVGVEADGFAPAHINLAEARLVNYYRFNCDVRLRPHPPSGASRHPIGVQAWEFSPVIERTVNDDGAGTNFFIDLDKGTLHTPPAGLSPRDTTPFVEWVRANGIDACGETGAGVRGLVGLDVLARPIASARWNSITPQELELDEVLRDEKAEPTEFFGLNGTFLTGKGDLPETYIFRTRGGGMGILQITGFAENPRGVKIRYKLLQPGGVAAQAERPGASSGNLTHDAAADVNAITTGAKNRSERVVVVDRRKFGEIYPAVWFNPATGETAPLDAKTERPPDGEYEIWIEPRDPEFRIGRSATNFLGMQLGFAPVGKGSTIFEKTKSWQPPYVEADLAKLMRGSGSSDQPVFFCQGKTSACLIMITDWDPGSEIIGFRWKRLALDGIDAGNL